MLLHLLFLATILFASQLKGMDAIDEKQPITHDDNQYVEWYTAETIEQRSITVIFDKKTNTMSGCIIIGLYWPREGYTLVQKKLSSVQADNLFNELKRLRAKQIKEQHN